MDFNNSVKLVAGGGGGDGAEQTNGMGDAGTNETPGSYYGLSDPSAGVGGHSNGGGGVFGDGGSYGGSSFNNGGIGGYPDKYGDGEGGFGGGGGGTSNEYGGGGGGYTGGNSGNNNDNGQDSGQGGGSYNAGTNQVNLAGANEGHGRVIIRALNTPPSDILLPISTLPENLPALMLN